MSAKRCSLRLVNLTTKSGAEYEAYCETLMPLGQELCSSKGRFRTGTGWAPGRTSENLSVFSMCEVGLISLLLLWYCEGSGMFLKHASILVKNGLGKV